MRILSIETSCDETALSIVEARGTYPNIKLRVLGNVVLSQTQIHKPLGGVVPSLAKREHGINLIPLLKEVLKKAKLEKRVNISKNKIHFEKILEREPELLKHFLKYIPSIKNPGFDAIAVTYGPGLEPALWVGLSFAKALAAAWGTPVIPVNHMEGHMISGLLEHKKNGYALKKFSYPLIGLLISGGHTEIVLSEKWLAYNIIGETRDDAVGEAFDKVARMLKLPYPGGPQIARLAGKFPKGTRRTVHFPRPMIRDENFDFSFSGLKTSVLYFLKARRAIPTALKQEVAREFQDAVTEVLVSKTLKAARLTRAQAVIVGGGVSANDQIRKTLEKEGAASGLNVLISPRELTGDNALMIAAAAYAHIVNNKKIALSPKKASTLKAQGNLRLS